MSERGIKLSEKDHRALDALLEGVLDDYKEGRLSRMQARSTLAHVFTAAAIQNEGEVRGWLTPETYANYKRNVRAG